VQEALVAFSNTNGGVIFLGVRDDRSVPGLTLTQQVRDTRPTTRSTLRTTSGRVDVREIDVGGTPVHVSSSTPGRGSSALFTRQRIPA